MNYLVLDTETAPTVHHGDNKVHPETSLVYDLGYVIANTSGEVLCKRSFIIAETFNNIALMKTAYYASKLPQYREGASYETDKNGWKIASFLEVYHTLNEDCKKFHVKRVCAYNIRFDLQALRNTMETYSNGFRSFTLPYGLKLIDIWDAASIITGTKKYVKWCQRHGFVKSSGNPNTGAETVFSYLTDNVEYVERHTALEDCLIENDIFQAVLKKHKKYPHTLGQGWRAASKIAKKM